MTDFFIPPYFFRYLICNGDADYFFGGEDFDTQRMKEEIIQIYPEIKEEFNEYDYKIPETLKEQWDELAKDFEIVDDYIEEIYEGEATSFWIFKQKSTNKYYQVSGYFDSWGGRANDTLKNYEQVLPYEEKVIKWCPKDQENSLN